MPMNQVLPGLWIGDWESPFEVDDLNKENIHYILSVMRLSASMKIPEVPNDPWSLTIIPLITLTAFSNA